jgi:hypothetical protein
MRRHRRIDSGTILPASLRSAPRQYRVDPLFHDVARPEDEHLARSNRHFFSGLGIAAYALPLGPDVERTKRRKLDAFALGQCAGNLTENCLDDLMRLLETGKARMLTRVNARVNAKSLRQMSERPHFSENTYYVSLIHRERRATHRCQV